MHLTDDIKIIFGLRRNGHFLTEESSFSLSRSQPTLILMPSGFGKTILSEALTGILERRSGLEIDCKVSINSQVFDLSNGIGKAKIPFRTRLVPQNPFSYLLELRVSDEILSPLENSDVPFSQAEQKAIHISEQLGLKHLWRRNPLTLSGGEIQKVSIAVALAASPELLVLDDPFGELDGQACEALTRILLSDAVSNQMWVCVISSYANLDLLKSSNVYFLAENKKTLVKSGLTQRTVPSEFSRGIGYRVKSSVRQHSKPTTIKHRNAAILDSISKPLVEMHNLSFKYPGQVNDSLHDIDLVIRSGNKYGLVGSNGAGKSTLLSLILGFEKSPSVKVYGEKLSKDRIRILRSRTGICFQTYHHYFFHNTPREELLWSFRKVCCSGSTVLDADTASSLEVNLDDLTHDAEELAERFGLDGVMDELCENISVQQRRLLAIATAIIEAIDLLVMDEPTAGLDHNGRETVYREILERGTTNTAAIIISHDLEFLDRVVDYTIELEAGCIVNSWEVKS